MKQRRVAAKRVKQYNNDSELGDTDVPLIGTPGVYGPHQGKPPPISTPATEVDADGSLPLDSPGQGDDRRKPVEQPDLYGGPPGSRSSHGSEGGDSVSQTSSNENSSEDTSSRESDSPSTIPQRPKGKGTRPHLGLGVRKKRTPEQEDKLKRLMRKFDRARDKEKVARMEKILKRMVGDGLRCVREQLELEEEIVEFSQQVGRKRDEELRREARGREARHGGSPRSPVPPFSAPCPIPHGKLRPDLEEEIKWVNQQVHKQETMQAGRREEQPMAEDEQLVLQQDRSEDEAGMPREVSAMPMTIEMLSMQRIFDPDFETKMVKLFGGALGNFLAKGYAADGRTLFADLVINEEGPYRALIDTGAMMSLIHKDLIPPAYWALCRPVQEFIKGCGGQAGIEHACPIQVRAPNFPHGIWVWSLVQAGRMPIDSTRYIVDYITQFLLFRRIDQEDVNDRSFLPRGRESMRESLKKCKENPEMQRVALMYDRLDGTNMLPKKTTKVEYPISTIPRE